MQIAKPKIFFNSFLRNEDHKSLKEQKYDDHNSNTLPYRPAYTSPMMYTSPLKSSATNKAFMHN